MRHEMKLAGLAGLAAALLTLSACGDPLPDDEGVVPIENSVGGSVSVTLDLLIHESALFIRHEIVLPIQHFLPHQL